MGTEFKCKSSRASGITTKLLLASLGLNVFLVVQLFHRRPTLPPQPTRAQGVLNQQAEAALTVSVATNAVSQPVATNEPLPFLWSQIESADYRQYIANLRAVGCPEQIIRDIVMADVNQAFAARAVAIWRPPVREYWQKPKIEEPSPAQMKQLMALSKDKAAVLQELLGVRPSEQQMVDTVHLRIGGSEHQLLFLPEDKRAAALQALADADFEMREFEMHLKGRYSTTDEQKLFDEKLKLLAKVLSLEESLEFRVRNSPAAQSLRQNLQYFNCTREEFHRLMELQEQTKGNDFANTGDRTVPIEQVRRLFGDERAQEFERATDPFYIVARQRAEVMGLPLELVEKAWEVTRDLRVAVNGLKNDAGLSAEERNRRVKALTQQAAANLNVVLGSQVARDVIAMLPMITNPQVPP